MKNKIALIGIITIIFGLFTFQISIAANVVIKVKDSITKMPIEKAKILIERVIIADPYTDCNGNLYLFVDPGRYRIIVEKGNVKEERIVDIRGDSTIEFYLRPEFEQNIYLINDGRVKISRNDCYIATTSSYYKLYSFSYDIIELEALNENFKVFAFYVNGRNVRNETESRVIFSSNANYTIFAVFGKEFTIEEIIQLLNKLLKIAETQNAKLDEIIKSLNDITKILNGLDLKDDEIIQLLNKVISEIKDQKLKLEEILDYLSKKDERVAYPIPIKEEEKNHCLTFLNIQNLELKRGENELTILLQNCGDFIEENITIVLNFLDKVEYKYLLNIYPNEIKHLKFKIFVPYDFINGVANVYAYNLYNNIFAAFYIFSIPSKIEVIIPEKIFVDNVSYTFLKIKNIGIKTEKVKLKFETKEVVIMASEYEFEVLPKQEKIIRLDFIYPEDFKSEIIKISANEKEKLVEVIRQQKNEKGEEKIVFNFSLFLTLLFLILLIIALAFILNEMKIRKKFERVPY